MKIFKFGDPGADIVLIQPVFDQDPEGIKKEASVIAGACSVPFQLIAAGVDDWNNDLSPWEAPPVFGKDGFGGGAAGTLDE
ncbi:MAG: esterase, partial [Lachnospiraceae bacterium]|nr:esterase [Lachnospiraceae bacterium]